MASGVIVFLQVSISLLLRRLRVWLQTVISVGIVAWTGWLSSRSFVLYDCSVFMATFISYSFSFGCAWFALVRCWNTVETYFLGPETEVRDLRRLVLQMLPFAGGGRTNRTMILLVMPDYLSTIPGHRATESGATLEVSWFIRPSSAAISSPAASVGVKK